MVSACLGDQVPITYGQPLKLYSPPLTSPPASRAADVRIQALADTCWLFRLKSGNTARNGWTGPVVSMKR